MFTLEGKIFGYTVIAALALLYVGSKNWLTGAPTAQITHSTAVGERRHLVLQDGSQADLNTGTEMRARFGATRHEVAVTRGEARFRVERNDHIPLFVTVGNATLTAAGADFSVRLVKSGQVDVLVQNGRVDVSAPFHGSSAELWGLGFSRPVSLTVSAGESISLQANNAYTMQRLSAAELELRTAWIDGWIWFAREPLPEAVAEFNRYHDQQLVLVDPRLASLEIGGRFRSSDLDSFIATLERSFEVQTATATVSGTRLTRIYLTGRCGRAVQQCNWPKVQ